MSPAHALKRKVLADKIVARSWDWQVCQGCEALVKRTVAHCPLCHAYRFETGTFQVIDAAFKLGARPVAETGAYLPRTTAIL